jgi:hypothetical protein
MYLLLWHNGRFHVEVLNWWGSDINIHDHNFSGIQMQLAGTSLNIVYQSDVEARSTRYTERWIRVNRAEIWKPGDRSIVRPGGTEPHTVHHLSIPTVSLLFRTIPIDEYSPQLNYFPPSVSASYTIADVIFRKKLNALRVLAEGNPADFQRTFREITASNSLTENLFTLIKLTDILFDSKHTDLLVEYADRGINERRSVEVASYRRATEFLLETLKPREGLSEEEALSLAILAGSFNQQSLSAILDSLTEAGYVIDIERHVKTLAGRLPHALRTDLSKILELFGLGSLRRQAGLGTELAA